MDSIVHIDAGARCNGKIRSPSTGKRGLKYKGKSRMPAFKANRQRSASTVSRHLPGWTEKRRRFLLYSR